MYEQAEIIRDAGPPASESGESADGITVLSTPYLLFLGDCTEPGYAKTAFGLRDWAGEKCIGEYALPGGTVSLGLPNLTPAKAAAEGARALIIGIANPGGVIDKSWMPALVQALEAGLDIISGLHAKLNDIAELRTIANRLGLRLIDIRTPPSGIGVATGRKRSGKRLLTVGTDCALGKKYSALKIAQSFQTRGINADFRATGQTGIMISGSGIPMDAVVSDFAAGAAEALSPDAAPDHWDVVEGQGSLFHPAYAGVSLSLLHGSQPDIVIVCHEPGRTGILGLDGYSVPSIEAVIEETLRLGARTNPAIRCGGVALNTSALEADAAAALIEAEAARLDIPVADPMRGGAMFERMLDSCLR